MAKWSKATGMKIKATLEPTAPILATISIFVRFMMNSPMDHIPQTSINTKNTLLVPSRKFFLST